MNNEPQAQGLDAQDANKQNPIQTPSSQPPVSQPIPQVQPVSVPTSATSKPDTFTPSSATSNPVTSTGLYGATAPTSSQATESATATEVAAEATKTHSGKMKMIMIAAGILAVAGTAAGLYFSGILNPAGQNADQLKNAADSQQAIIDNMQSSQETQELTTQQTQETSGLTQVAVNACPVGQAMDPVTNRCACDINNNYFSLNLDGAYVQPAAGQEPTQCTTCTALIGQINDLANSNDPADVTRKAQLDALAKNNNCSPCSIFDDRIASASQNKEWDKYFDLAVEKSNDKTCGRSLGTCDSLKWQLLFLNDLRDKAGKDQQTSPDVLASLQKKQQSIAEELGTNAACYSLESLCTDLKKIYGNNMAASTKTSVPGISSTPLIGQTGMQITTAATQQTQEQLMPGNTQQDLTIPDISAITLDKLFDKDFYMMHCPVDGQQSVIAPMGTQQQTGGKVSRVKRTTSGSTVQSSSTAAAPVMAPSLAPTTKGSTTNTPESTASPMPNILPPQSTTTTSGTTTTTTTTTTSSQNIPSPQLTIPPGITLPAGSGSPGSATKPAGIPPLPTFPK